MKTHHNFGIESETKKNLPFSDFSDSDFILTLIHAVHYISYYHYTIYYSDVCNYLPEGFQHTSPESAGIVERIVGYSTLDVHWSTWHGAKIRSAQ